MKTLRQTKLKSRQAKKIERELVTFYKTVGEMVDLNSRTTEIFAQLKIYDALTQEQLQQLTGFSLGTISSTLQLFLQTEIIGRQYISGTHTNIYSIRPERVQFVYTPSTLILEDLERLDSYIIEKQTELQNLHDRHPIEVTFLHRRLNSLRNYIEVQRRQIGGEKRYSFFQEDTSDMIPLSEMIVYPFDVQELGEIIMDILGYFKDDPIMDKILQFFFTHRSVDQQTLMDLSGFSRSTVSRFLQGSLKRGFIHALPKEYKRPRIYFLKSISMSILSRILSTDSFIFSYIPRLKEILLTLQTDNTPVENRRDRELLKSAINTIIEQIKSFQNETRIIRKAYEELTDFLENDGP